MNRYAVIKWPAVMIWMWRYAVMIGLIVVAACDRSAESGSPALIQIDGSSTVYPILEAMAEEFQIAQQGAVRMTVGISGSGGGFDKFCRGELDIASASRPIEPEELRRCATHQVTFVELPIAYDAITLVTHPANDWLDYLTLEELRRIWAVQAQGRVTNWQQVRATFPDVPLNLYGAGPNSGTFDYFTAAVNGVGRASRGDYTASEDDNLLVRGVANDRNALGYFGLAYYHENRDKLRPVALVNEYGQAVLPTVDTVQQGRYRLLSRPVFLYVSTRGLQRLAVRRFLDFVFEPRNRQEIITWVGYVPLPAHVYRLVQTILAEQVSGSRFQGSWRHVFPIEEALNRSPAAPPAN